MEKDTVLANDSVQPLVLTADALLDHWQGHRKLTRRAIEVFPEKELFQYSVGSMRPFAELALEMIAMAARAYRVLQPMSGNDLKSLIRPCPKPKKIFFAFGMKQQKRSIHIGRRYHPIVSRKQ